MSPEVRQVLRARLAIARVTKGKTEAVLRRVCSDGRLRGILAYWGAHTGRWSGRGFQPQNLTRPVEGVDYAKVHAALQRILRTGIPSSVPQAVAYLQSVCAEAGCDMGGLLSSLLRGVIVSSTGLLAFPDYSSVEARGLLWLAKDDKGLEMYRAYDEHGGPDPYMHAASDIYQLQPADVTKAQRQIGKVAVLACGYGGARGAFEKMAVGYGVDVTELDVDQIVNGWRDGRPDVAGVRKGGFHNDEGRWIVTRAGGLWKDLERAVRLAIETKTGTFTAGRCQFKMEGEHLVCTLPSGRPLIYREAKIELVENQWGKEAETITYLGKLEGRNAWGRVDTYGGKLSENVTQATTRDLMADALVKMEKLPGVNVVLTVHDEIVAEVDCPERIEDMYAVMLDKPAWAEGLPLAVEGTVDERYGK